jgi:hypothetical protein
MYPLMEYVKDVYLASMIGILSKKGKLGEKIFN